jgi:uncharacterized Zn-binding protein involved in type VI secretion
MKRDMPYSIEGKEVILLGDTTTHGGKVITASDTHKYMGTPIARVGDMVECPQCKGTYPIIEGAPRAFDRGKPIARHGDKVACGATLISQGNRTDTGTLYAAADNIATDAGGVPASKWAAPLHETGPQCEKSEFFALYNYFKKMADELDTNVDFIMAQAAWESGWGKSEAAQKHNLFGVNRPPNDPRIYRGKDGKLYGTNAEYDSYEEGIQSWVRKWGPHVKGAKTHDEYIDNLLKHGYNVVDKNYKIHMKESYNSVVKRKKACGILN